MSGIKRGRGGMAVGFLTAMAALGIAAPVWSAGFYPLGDLPDGGFSSTAWDVSAGGSVVVGRGKSPQGDEAFRWTMGGGLQGLGALAGAGESTAYAVSGNGAVVAGESDLQAFLWTADGGMQPLGYLSGGSVSLAAGVSGDGSVIVGYGDTAGGPGGPWNDEAFRWTSGGGMQGLGYLPGCGSSKGSGVSADGTVVAGYCHSGSLGYQAFRWTAVGGMLPVGSLPGGSGEGIAYGVSTDGSAVVGGASDAYSWQAFRWTAGGGMVGLGYPSGWCGASEARACSGDGSVVVGAGVDPATAAQEAFIWDAQLGMRSVRAVLEGLGVPAAGWRLLAAYGVSDDGRCLAGAGDNASGQREAWLLILPQPGDVDLDEDVDFADYQALEAGFGATSGATWQMGDMDFDGDVDFADYQVIEARFGTGVPEPGVLVLMLFGAAGGAIRARRKRR